MESEGAVGRRFGTGGQVAAGGAGSLEGGLNAGVATNAASAAAKPVGASEKAEQRAASQGAGTHRGCRGSSRLTNWAPPAACGPHLGSQAGTEQDLHGFANRGCGTIARGIHTKRWSWGARCRRRRQRAQRDSREKQKQMLYKCPEGLAGGFALQAHPAAQQALLVSGLHVMCFTRWRPATRRFPRHRAFVGLAGLRGRVVGQGSVCEVAAGVGGTSWG